MFLGGHHAPSQEARPQLPQKIWTTIYAQTVWPTAAKFGRITLWTSDLLQCVSDITSRRRLRSSTSSELVIPLSRLVTVGNRSFAAAGPRLWHTLPEDNTSAPSLLVFRRKLKTHFFGNLIRTLYCSLCGLLRPVVLEVLT